MHSIESYKTYKKKVCYVPQIFPICLSDLLLRDAALLKVALCHVRNLYDSFLVSTIAVIVERKNEKVVSLVPDECIVMMVNDNAIVLISGRLREL